MLAKFCGDCSIEEAAARACGNGAGRRQRRVEVLMRAGPPARRYLPLLGRVHPATRRSLRARAARSGAAAGEAATGAPWVASLPANEQEVRLAYLAQYGTVNARGTTARRDDWRHRRAVDAGCRERALYPRGHLRGGVHVAPAGEYGSVLPRDLGAVACAPFITRHRGMALAALALGVALAAMRGKPTKPFGIACVRLYPRSKWSLRVIPLFSHHHLRTPNQNAFPDFVS